MQTHQLRLSENSHARRLLENRLGISQIAVRQLIYGRLFEPLLAGECPLPEGMSAQGLRGRWLYCSQWSEWMDPESEFRIIPKPLWPVVLTSELVQSLPRVDTAELLQLGAMRCTLVVAGDSLEPIFLVPDAWPDAPKG